MKTDTAVKIVAYLREKKQATAKDLADYLGISRQALFRQLAQLLNNNQIYKIGKPPKVFYFEKEAKEGELKHGSEIDEITKKFIEENFLIITPTGERKEGLAGFTFWCQKTGQPIQKTAQEYMKTWEKYNSFRKNGLIDGLAKMKTTFSRVSLDDLFYLDFYSIERFGKTKLGQLLLYAKQSQDKVLMKELSVVIKPRVEEIIKKYKIDGVGFIPPTVKRETQLMKELERNLQLNVRAIPIIKIMTEVAVPQKTLNKLEDRIENAKKTIIVNDTKLYDNILIIDDAVGSGATLNETAGQIRAKGICRGKIIGLAITGSFKGFDIISEV